MSLASQTERGVCAMPKPFRDWFAEYYHAVCSNEGRQMTHGEVYSCIATWKEALRTQTEREEQLVKFVESLTDALGPFPYLDGTTVISAARQALSAYDAGGE